MRADRRHRADLTGAPRRWAVVGLVLLMAGHSPQAQADPIPPVPPHRCAANAPSRVRPSSAHNPVYFTGLLESESGTVPMPASQPMRTVRHASIPASAAAGQTLPSASSLQDRLAELGESSVEPLFDPVGPGHPEYPCQTACPETFQLLPDGLLYPTYRAGEKEPRMASVWMYESGRGWIWENALGGRVGIARMGTPGARHPQGWQLDLEGAVFPRLDWEVHSDLEAADFRAGVPVTWRRGPTAVKCGYYHISSHVGDEYLERNPGFQRRNYVRDALLLGLVRSLSDDLLVYGEVAVAPSPSGGAEPWEVQFGTEYSPAQHCSCGYRPVPYAAINGHLREEFDFGGSVNVVAGWQWLSDASDRRLRAGVQYYNGKALQYSFFDKHEELYGMGLWLDF